MHCAADLIRYVSAHPIPFALGFATGVALDGFPVVPLSVMGWAVIWLVVVWS
jgi:hypothetical protein